MPETRFHIQWPDGQNSFCYSPSSVIRHYFEPGQEYGLEEFVAKAREALQLASDRVQAKYGYPCGLARGQLQEIETMAQQFTGQAKARVKMVQFLD